MLAHGKRSAAVGKGRPTYHHSPSGATEAVRGVRTFSFGLCVRLKLAPVL